ncbi:MAG: hypothetical protein ACK559_14185, partial [bacterium]
YKHGQGIPGRSGRRGGRVRCGHWWHCVDRERVGRVGRRRDDRCGLVGGGIGWPCERDCGCRVGRERRGRRRVCERRVVASVGRRQCVRSERQVRGWVQWRRECGVIRQWVIGRVGVRGCGKRVVPGGVLRVCDAVVGGVGVGRGRRGDGVCRCGVCGRRRRRDGGCRQHKQCERRRRRRVCVRRPRCCCGRVGVGSCGVW